MTTFNLADVSEVAILFVVFLLLWGGHWMPWRVLLTVVDEDGNLKRVLAYGYGCLIIFLGYSTWAVVYSSIGLPTVGVWSAVRFLMLNMLSAGLGTLMPRGIKWLLERRAKQGDLEDLRRGSAKSR